MAQGVRQHASRLARRLKDFETENMRRKKLVADLNLDKMIRAEALKVRSQVPLAGSVQKFSHFWSVACSG